MSKDDKNVMIYFSVFEPVTETAQPATEQDGTYIDGLTNISNRGVQLVLPEFCGDRCTKECPGTEETPAAFEDINSAIRSVTGTAEWQKYDIE